MNRRVRTALYAVVGALALSAGLWLGSRTEENGAELPEISGFVVREPRELPAFRLVDGDGGVFDSTDFAGGWSFVYFGYTYCPDICPMSMVEMGRTARVLEQTRADLPVRFYLVSVDPDRDTPERMGDYAGYFHPSFRGLTGDAAEIGKFASAAGVVYEVPESPQDDDYLVGHSSFITLLDPHGRIQAFFTGDLDGERIAAEFQQIVAAGGG